jgi:metallo-beta-lactamase family protein
MTTITQGAQPMPQITFHGAAGTVTGSAHLLQIDSKKILLDCGQFQGPWEVEQRNYEHLPCNPRTLHAMILSHGHLDHCGRIPLLSKGGFKGPIYSTPPTRDIARLILLDSAHVIKEEFQWKRRKLTRMGITAREPLYSIEDVYYSMDAFNHQMGYNQTVKLGATPEIRLTLRDAGHILGSSQVYLEYENEHGKPQTILYTGDLGDGGRPLMSDPAEPVQPVHTMIMETTYGNRDHKTYSDTVAEFEDAVTFAMKKRGTALIPAFALERTQEVLYHIAEMKRTGRLSKKIPVFLNSPLAIDITRIYHTHSEFCCMKLREALQKRQSPFVFPGLILTETIEESMAIHSVEGPKIVIAGSGMMNGGRIKHHLKHLLWRESTSLIVVGYQAEGTLGRKIIDGAKEVQIFGEPVAVKAKINTINGFSAHAGQSTLLNMARKASPKRLFLVHGEPEVSKAFAEKVRKILTQTEIILPAAGETYKF